MGTIGITGGTGFVGRHLATLLGAKGHRVVIFTRNPEKHHRAEFIEYSYWNPELNKCDHSAIRKLNAVVHLSGTNLNRRWTNRVKRNIVKSRVNGTSFLVTQLKNEAPDCKTFIAASAVGYYGADTGQKPFEETDLPAGDFLADVCVQWEQESLKASDTMRTVIYRFGIVLGKDDGAFPQLARPLTFGIMPVFGTGKQVISWIHIDDLARLLLYGITNNEMNGIYNAVSPRPVSQKELMQTIASAKGGMKLPVTIPASVLNMLLGEMSHEITKSCTVSAEKVRQAGFSFQYPDIRDAVNTIIAS